MSHAKTILSFLLLISLLSCNEGIDKTLFSRLDNNNIGIDFINNLPYTEEFNTYTYRNFYNGGGVALGDINNDGLVDIYFTGNLMANKLYLNKGNWQFDDITEMAGVECANVWSAGATFADVNGDGLLDLYVCKAGPPGGENRHNELFINQGDLTFEEESEKYGLDLEGLSIHSAFFDYDKDGDLDCYVLNNSIRSVGGFDLKEGLRDIPDPEGNKFFENRNGKFVDVTQQAGFYSSNIGYGLGITLSDFNKDGWTDVFISNDFFERDYLYINEQDGTFSEQGTNWFSSMSMGSMGADACDIDNDLLPDLFVTEMLPKTLDRKKTKTHYDNWNKYQFSVKEGYHHQFSRNVLQRNMESGRFFELGRFSGVAATEWSWASLIQDFDNDGLKDLFVSNGLYKDLLDKDYLNYTANDAVIRSKVAKKESFLKTLIDSIPSKAIVNDAFKNVGDFHFEHKSQDWGFDEPSFSNGSAYGDLDNDGDLDLVVNNVNMPPFIYKNNLDTSSNRSIQLNLSGEGKNLFALGTKVYAYYGDKQAYIENFTSKGFQSCVDSRVHIGMGKARMVDSLIIEWPDDRITYLTNLATNKLYNIDQKSSSESFSLKNINAQRKEINRNITSLDFKHEEMMVNLFNRERLLPSMPGYDGPVVAAADLNGDQIEDLFVSGGKKQSSYLFLSSRNGFFDRVPFIGENKEERTITCVAFFDSDADGDLDLYLGYGDKILSSFSPVLNDQLFINNGNGQFSESNEKLPFTRPIHTGDVAVGDLNGDGMLDIVVAEKMKNELYGYPGDLFILRNEGDNKYEIISPESLREIGMVSAVELKDMNNDDVLDIVCLGRWMSLRVIENSLDGFFSNATERKVANSAGLWNSMELVDIDLDGDLDVIAGNEGLNSFMTADMKMFISDFDNNGMGEQIICKQIDNDFYPVQDLDDLYSQLPMLKKKFRFYSEFATASIEEMFGADKVKEAIQHSLEEVRTGIFINEEKGFTFTPFPDKIQYSSVFATLTVPDNKAWKTYAGGNNYQVKPQFGRQDASRGWQMKYEFKNKTLDNTTSIPLSIDGQIRAIELWNKKYLFGINNDSIRVLVNNNKMYE